MSPCHPKTTLKWGILGLTVLHRGLQGDCGRRGAGRHVSLVSEAILDSYEPMHTPKQPWNGKLWECECRIGVREPGSPRGMLGDGCQGRGCLLSERGRVWGMVIGGGYWRGVGGSAGHVSQASEEGFPRRHKDLHPYLALQLMFPPPPSRSQGLVLISGGVQSGEQ